MARSGVGSPSPNIMILAVHITGGPLSPAAPDRNDLQNARLRGGAGRTRTNHQSVMEHGWCPTNYPGRTPIQIPEALLFCVNTLAFFAGQSTSVLLAHFPKQDF